MVEGTRVVAWKPPVDGLREVLHANFTDHAYPMHTHDCWTLLVVDVGEVRYDLDRRSHGTRSSPVTLLPPDVPHDGRSVHPEGFRKRVLYLETDLLGADLIGTAVDTPGLVDRLLRLRIQQLHEVLARRTEDLETQSRLALIRERLLMQLNRRRSQARRTGGRQPAPEHSIATGGGRQRELSRGLRDLLDTRVTAGLSLSEAAQLLGSTPTALIRAFTREYGLPPHRYLTGRRVDLARGQLLAGAPVAEAAVRAGFYDQSHLTRHFRRMLGVGPGLYSTGTVRHPAGIERS